MEIIKCSSKREEILQTLTDKSVTKQIVYENTKEALDLIKERLLSLYEFLSPKLSDKHKNLLVNYYDRSEFEAEFKLASDILVFNMHSNIFNFEKTHDIWRTSYVKEDNSRAYCGVIHVYNFLADSFKYQRMNDMGFLVARIFVNKDKHFFIEGKKQMGLLFNDFCNSEISKAKMCLIVETAVNYCLNFDLISPPYEDIEMVTVDEMFEAFSNMKMKTSKKMGFKFSGSSEENFKKNNDFYL